jgi:UDPglucose 6-dehydrogenase
MKIAVIGTGYVGLVTGTCLAETGNIVSCIDIDANKIARLNKGEVPIYEPQLDAYFERNMKAQRLIFTTSLVDGIKDAEVIFLALPTPPGEDGSADLSYILKVAEQLGSLIEKYTIIVDKSTVPVGTADKVHEIISKKARGAFSVVSNPEFLREGFAISDFMKPDRVVIGTDDAAARKVMERLYKPFVRQGNPIIFMDAKSAELTKYAANAFLATKITFMNEIANYCEIVGANVDQVRIGIGSDERIGKRFLFPGIGYGGSCFPKDVQALVKAGKDDDFDFNVLRSVMEVNTRQKTILFPKIMNYFDGNIRGKNIAVWGLAFKPDTDDIREAPALYLINKLVESGAVITAFDPEAMENVRTQIGDKIQYAENEYDALKEADALIICTEWSIFRNPDFSRIKAEMNGNALFDGRNLFDLEDMESKGFCYFSIGRKAIISKQ